ncbi:MAG TPA: hypothetical protein VLM05_01925, partial [Mycobacteriales bacterium]|nr:hypothetical protein [Mycobacteriales bacterium]
MPPPPFGVAVSPGGASLFQPPKRRAERLRAPDVPAPRWVPHPSDPPADEPAGASPDAAAESGRPRRAA